MRLGSANTFDKALQNIYSRQSDIASQQEKLTSGKNINRPSDDPTGAAQAERALTRISRIATDQRALAVQNNAITLAETALTEAINVSQSLRELVVSAGSGTFNASDRASVANEMQGLREQLFNIANRKDTNSIPLFGGLGSALAPFVAASALPGAAVTFDGVAGQTAPTETAVPGAMDGNAIWMSIPDAVTPTILTNLFQVVDDAIAGISSGGSSTAISAVVSTALTQIDAGMNRLESARGQAGAWLKRVDTITNTQEGRTLQLTADKSRAEDLNLVTGYSEFQRMNTGYQAALQSYAQIQKLSLFNYIG
jgi:flagellin-like hook-associated protein FlgL